MERLPKWNKVEHRLFCYISKNWEGKPLLDIKTVVSYIGSTKTKTRLTVNCVVDTNKYECSIKISDEENETIDIERIEPYGDYAYIIRGFKKNSNNFAIVSKMNYKGRKNE